MRPTAWIPFLVLCFIGGAIFHSPLLITVSITTAAIIGIASWWRGQSLKGVIYRRQFHYTRGFPGETTALKLTIENRKFLPLTWLRVADPWPRAVGPDDLTVLAPSHIADEGFLTHVFTLRWFERVSRQYSLLFRERGYYRVGPAQIASGDLFGIYETEQAPGKPETLTVFPRLLSPIELNLTTEDPFGDRRSRRRLFEDPNQPMGVRSYTSSDDFRRVHWPATVRTGELQVKVYQPVSSQVMMLCLNIATFPRYWEGIYPALLEHLISVTATFAYYSVEQGYAVGLVSNGCLAHADQPFKLPPGRSSRQLAELLQALAEVSPFMTAPFEKFLLHSVPEMPYGATLVIITALVTPELVETLTRLKKYRRNMTLISLEENEPPYIHGIKEIHLPFKE